jgi:hypothetical protein
MKEANDNIGGYKTIELIFADSVKSITEDSAGRVSIVLNPFEEWTELPFSKPKIEAKPKTEDAGTLYENSVSLLIPHQHLADELCQNIKKALYTYCIIRYTTVMDETFIIGGTEYPLQLTCNRNLRMATRI